jgi:hypothetical protein
MYSAAHSSLFALKDGFIIGNDVRVSSNCGRVVREVSKSISLDVAH